MYLFATVKSNQGAFRCYFCIFWFKWPLFWKYVVPVGGFFQACSCFIPGQLHLDLLGSISRGYWKVDVTVYEIDRQLGAFWWWPLICIFLSWFLISGAQHESNFRSITWKNKQHHGQHLSYNVRHRWNDHVGLSVDLTLVFPDVWLMLPSLNVEANSSVNVHQSNVQYEIEFTPSSPGHSMGLKTMETERLKQFEQIWYKRDDLLVLDA